MACVIGHEMIKYTKMNANLWHFNECGVDIYYSGTIQSNAHKCETTYLTLNSESSGGNITYNKWEKNWTGLFNVVPHIPIAMHIITIVIIILEMTCINKVPEGQLKIIMEICGFSGAPRVPMWYRFLFQSRHFGIWTECGSKIPLRMWNEHWNRWLVTNE